jgi:copper transport protein
VAWRLLSESRWGSLWIARELLALALLGALWLLLRDGRRSATPLRRSLILCASATAALSLVAVQALSGHAFDLTPNRAFAVVVAGIHLLAALVWIGGVLATVVALGPLLGRRRQEPAALARACLAPFSVLAAGCVGLLVVTGLYYAGRQVASLDALLTTVYGQTLLGKLGLVLGVGAVGCLNALILRDGWTPLSATRLPGLLAAEATLGVGLLLVVGLLTASPPARGPEFAQVPASTPSFRSGSADDLLVSVSVKPNRPGPNIFEVGAVSTRRPAPAAIDRVRLRFTGRQGSVTSPPLTEIEPGRYRSSGRYLYESGAWRIEALVDRAGLGERRARFEWAVAPSGNPQPVLVSRRPLEPILTRAAAVLFLGLVVTCAWYLLRRLPQGRRAAADPLIRQRLEEGAK